MSLLKKGEKKLNLRGKNMMTIEQKREACVQYDASWLQNGAERDDMEWIIRDGWEGWANQSIEAIERFYKDNIEEEV